MRLALCNTTIRGCALAGAIACVALLMAPDRASAAGAATGAGSGASAGSGYAQRPEVREFIDALALDHDFDPAQLAKLFSQAQTQTSSIRAMSAPIAQPPRWFEYAPQFLSPERIAGGIAFREKNRAALERAEREFGVPAEVIVAIIGVETFYGRVAGKYRVFDALTTLAFDYPRRGEFFRDELRQFLLLAREWKIPPLTIKGSFAGAMGLPQFMPSSFRRYAIDYDSDGRIDLLADVEDAVGSIANFLSRHGWQRGHPVLVPAIVDKAEAEKAVAELGGLSERRDYLAWTAINIAAAEPADIDPQWAAALVLLEQPEGPTYRLGFNNFYVLTRYNRSRLYATAVWDLSQAIAQAPAAPSPGR